MLNHNQNLLIHDEQKHQCQIDNIDYYFTVSKYTTGGTTTLLFTSDPAPLGWDTNNTTPVEVKTNGVATTAVLVPSDRLIVNLYVNNNQSSEGVHELSI